MLQASTEVEIILAVSFSCHSTSVDACSIGKWWYVCHLWQEKDTASVNSTSVDACSIGKWLYVCHLWHEKDTASVNSTSVDACIIGLPMLGASTEVD
jgi:hypothetical protein